jgi:hypothetical protein
MASVRKNLMKNFQKSTFLDNSFNKDKSVGLKEIVDTKKNHKICNLCEIVAAKMPMFGIWPA